MMRRWYAIGVAVAACAIAGGAAPAAPGVARQAPDPPAPRWIATWGSAQLPLEAKDLLPALRGDRGITVRQVVRVSAGGTTLRVRFSNAFGDAPLVVARARAAAGGRASALAFAGQASAEIPAGAEIYSDPVALPLAPGGDLVVTAHLPAAPQRGTGHPGARATTRVAPGDQVDAAALAGAVEVPRWFALSDVEVTAPAAAGTIVAIGDSITDGYGVVPDSDGRWTDAFAARLRADTALAGWGVVNAGIGGNRVTLDGLGPNLVARFDRDVIARGGVRFAILLEGVNDLGTLTRERPASPAEHAALVRRITAAYAQIVARAHAHGIQVIGATVMPFGGNDYYHPDAANEADRQAVNAFIRTSGTFDAVIDFDAVMRDPARPDRLLPAYDSGDHLHPSMAGYRAMGDAVPLRLFADAPTAPRAKLALTFDDLPEHGPLPAGVTAAATVGRIVAALQAAGVRAPTGFVNGARATTPDGAAALARWRRAGFPFGNHGYAHRDLATIATAAFEHELVANEPVLARFSPRAGTRWFRYPFLSEGATPAARDAARTVLRRHGYRIAAVTMDFGDWAWNGAYARCTARGDAAAIAALEDRYLAAARIAALRSRAAAQATHGGDVPYVLLMHVGAFDARMLPRLLALYRGMGFDFVPLAEAQAHPAYRAANDLSLPGPSIDTRALRPPVLAPAPLPDAGVCA